MGLSGRKVKQRISADPRNLGWADDAARFGSNYLSKFGWDASRGLGAGGDGMKSHIKVSHKLDMLGIGAAQTKDPNGIAWKQNRDFESLLQRLNENLQAETPASDRTEESVADDESEDGEKKKKKRKHKETEEEGSERKKKKKRHSKDKRQGDDEESTTISVETGSMQVKTVVETNTVVEVQKVVALPRHRAHRARLIAAKNIASKSAAHISEILGVAPTSQPVQNVVAPGKLTSVTDTDALGMDKLTTSTKSLADYFKEKLDARMCNSSGTSTPTTSRADADDAFEAPRGGIGASRMRLEIQSQTRVEEETRRVGLSKFSSLMSSSFLAATSSASYVLPQSKEEECTDEGVARISEVESDNEAKQNSRKESKEKKRNKDALAESDEKVEKAKEKKSKRDKKGKGKATEEVEEVMEVDANEGEKRRQKREKKEKKKEKKAAEEALKANGGIEGHSHKKETQKRKHEERNVASTEAEDSGKPKHAKKCRKDS